MEALIEYAYRTGKKEPFGTLLRRIHDGLVAAPLPVSYEFAFTDSPVGSVSAVDRAVKKFPQLAALVRTAPAAIALVANKAIGGADTDLPFATLVEVADGLPRSLPFHSATVRFLGPAFGVSQSQVTGITAADSWWVSGRKRSLSARFVLDAGESARKAPAPEGALAVFLDTLGKPAKINRIPIIVAGPTQPGEPTPAQSVLTEIARKYRSRLADLVAEADMPHVLPSRVEALKTSGCQPHPLKPTLELYFRPLGYSCKGGSGTFTLRRRTTANHVVEVDLDVGTWSHSVTAHFRVHVPGGRCTLPMPVGPGLESGQYPIGEAERWDKIVANLAALARYFDHEVVPEVDAVAGPAPDWFDAPN